MSCTHIFGQMHCATCGSRWYSTAVVSEASCVALAVDFDTKVPDLNGKIIWNSKNFSPEEEGEARTFLAEMLLTTIAVFSRRMLTVSGRHFHAEWVTDEGRVICESGGSV